MPTKKTKSKQLNEAIQWPEKGDYVIIGIDPGEKSGAIVVVTRIEGLVRRQVFKMPPTIVALRKLLREQLRNTAECAVFLETPAGLPPSKGMAQRVSMFSTIKFYRHVGKLEGLLDGMRITWYPVTPLKWQNRLNCRTGGDKHISQVAAQRRFPDQKITLRNADAYLIAHYGCLYLYGAS